MSQSMSLAPDEEEKQEQLPQDYSTPFSPPSGVTDTSDDTHPQSDTNIDEHEHYDEGIAGATGVSEPRSHGVVDYDPDKNS